jgi:hypothetical protein
MARAGRPCLIKALEMLARRCFLHAAGFDPHDAASQHRRFVREAARFATTWNVAAQVSALQRSGSQSHWTITSFGPGWQVATEFQLLDWSDIVQREMKRRPVPRLFRGLLAFSDLVLSGTARRYFTANWRYGMFFLVPFLNVFLFAAVAILAARIAGSAVASALMSAVGGIAASVVVTVLLFAALMRWPGERWRVSQAMADWAFARDYMLGRHSGVSERIDEFAAQIVACARRPDVDEIIIAGHSLGATIAVDALARAFDRDPALGRRGPKLGLLTIGATIPKLALRLSRL